MPIGCSRLRPVPCRVTSPSSRASVCAIFLFLSGASLALVSSCSTVTRTVVAPPEVPGAAYVGNQACYDCHTNITRNFLGSAHGRLYFEGAKLSGQSGCESCHGPGSNHIGAGGGRGKFIEIGRAHV